jgi:hypothetical protein
MSQLSVPMEITERQLWRANLIAAAWREWLNFQQSDLTNYGDQFASEVIAMLAEKFFLVLETLIGHASDDRSSPVVISTVPHIPIKLQCRK